jgi:hypothetical protein
MLTSLITYVTLTFATVIFCDFIQGLINLWVDTWTEYHLRPLTTYVTTTTNDRTQDTDQVSEQIVQTASAPKRRRGRPRKAA